MNKIHVKRFAAWTDAKNAPRLEFVPMLFRRRLSFLSKMVVDTVHRVSEGLSPAHVTFASEFGEVQKQYRISAGILDNGVVSPAQFSLSVFNAPVGASSIVEKNTAGYSAIFGGKRSFSDGLREACAPVLSGREKERIFVFADEELPADYASIGVYPNPVCALALRLSSNAEDSICPLDISEIPAADTAAEQALYFFKKRMPHDRSV